MPVRRRVRPVASLKGPNMRCFVAIELPASVRARLAWLQTQLADLDRSIRWTRPEQVHLTVKFLGEVPESQVPQICRTTVEVAGQLAPIPLIVDGTGCFPPGGPVRIVWAGIQGPPPELVTCHEAIERAFAQLGYPPEERAFRPHLTIGRSRDQRGARGVRDAIATAGDLGCPPFTAGELVVFQSVLGRSGPAYTRLVTAKLGR